jgi:hypothetical protein
MVHLKCQTGWPSDRKVKFMAEIISARRAADKPINSFWWQKWQKMT